MMRQTITVDVEVNDKTWVEFKEIVGLLWGEEITPEWEIGSLINRYVEENRHVLEDRKTDGR